MDTLIRILHVSRAVFIVGPMAILPMTAMRAVRAGNGGQVAVLAKSTKVFSWLSLLTFVFGFGAMAMAPEEFELSFTTPWILWSIILYVIAFGLSCSWSCRRCARRPRRFRAMPDRAAAPRQAGYPAIAAGSGVVSLLLVAVVVLMVWKP